MRTLLLATATISLASLSIAVAGSQAAQPASKAAAHAPRYGTFGFDAAGMDRSVAPGQSFYNFANGNWTRTTQIPADQSNYGMFTVLADLSEARTRGILEEAARTPGSRMGDMYASFMDEAAIERAGITPIQPVLSRIKGLSDRSPRGPGFDRLADDDLTVVFKPPDPLRDGKRVERHHRFLTCESPSDLDLAKHLAHHR